LSRGQFDVPALQLQERLDLGVCEQEVVLISVRDQQPDLAGRGPVVDRHQPAASSSTARNSASRLFTVALIAVTSLRSASYSSAVGVSPAAGAAVSSGTSSTAPAWGSCSWEAGTCPLASRVA